MTAMIEFLLTWLGNNESSQYRRTASYNCRSLQVYDWASSSPHCNETCKSNHLSLLSVPPYDAFVKNSRISMQRPLLLMQHCFLLPSDLDPTRYLACEILTSIRQPIHLWKLGVEWYHRRLGKLSTQYT